jgi:hypothetical protein
MLDLGIQSMLMRMGFFLLNKCVLGLLIRDVQEEDCRDIRLRGPWRIAKPSMKRQDPRVNASANLRGFIATTC